MGSSIHECKDSKYGLPMHTEYSSMDERRDELHNYTMDCIKELRGTISRSMENPRML